MIESSHALAQTRLAQQRARTAAAKGAAQRCEADFAASREAIMALEQAAARLRAQAEQVRRPNRLHLPMFLWYQTICACALRHLHSFGVSKVFTCIAGNTTI